MIPRILIGLIWIIIYAGAALSLVFSALIMQESVFLALVVLVISYFLWLGVLRSGQELIACLISLMEEE